MGATGPTGAGSTGATGPTGATNLGNITITNQTISAVNPNSDISILPPGTGNVNLLGNVTIQSVPGQTIYPLTISGTTLHLSGNDNEPNTTIIDAFNSGSVAGANITFRRFGGTSAAPTTPLSGDVLGVISGRGYGGGATPAASFPTLGYNAMVIRANENFSTTNMGGRMEFWVTPNGSNVAQVGATITPTSVVIGNVVNSSNTLTITANAIVASNTANDLSIGTPGQTGNLRVNSTLQVVGPSGNVVLTNTDQGQIDIVSGFINPDKSAVFNLIGNWTNSYQPLTGTGGMIQITGHDNSPSRITNDSYGSTVYSGFVGRTAAGTAASPSATLANTSLSRFTGVPYTPTLGFNAALIAAARMDMILLATATDTSTPTRVSFSTTPVGSVTSIPVANVDTTGITLPYAGSGITFPDGSFQGSAGGAANVVVIGGATYAMTSTDRFVGVDYSGGSVTLTLPSAASCTLGTTLIIKDVGGNATANNIDINAQGGDLIDGAASQSITQDYNSYTLIYSRANTWSIV